MIKVTITVNVNGETLSKVLPEFPVTIEEAIEQQGADKVYDMFCRHFVIHEQAKLRQEWKDVQAIFPGTTVADYLRATAPAPEPVKVKRKVTRKRKPVRKTTLKLVRKSPKK